ncbi:MAG: dihydropteroate synthase [Synergistaceae bacterium]|nr:dihydropteroate synthase [Synergistaceae bacterium]
MTSPAGHTISLNMNTQIMAILNLTPDSFFAESRIDEKGILSRAEECLREGAYILDVGAESTRPGAEAVSEDEEIRRLVPALRLLRGHFPEVIISVDTYKPEIARAAADEGADIINDISGFTFRGDILDSEGMPETIAALKIPYVLSHITGTPKNMQAFENHADIVRELAEYFSAKIAALESAGVSRENIIIDPGLGFGKSSADNFAVLRDIESLSVWGLPVTAGHSRKRFTGEERLAGSVAVSALLSGRVSLLRVHDVKENAEALRIAREMMS